MKFIPIENITQSQYVTTNDPLHEQALPLWGFYTVLFLHVFQFKFSILCSQVSIKNFFLSASLSNILYMDYVRVLPLEVLLYFLYCTSKEAEFK